MSVMEMIETTSAASASFKVERGVRVALFTDSDVFAGTERHMLDLARGLQVKGVETSIACPDASPLAQRARESGLDVIPIEKRGVLDWEAIGILRKKLRSGEINLIHAHNGRTALSAALAVKMEGRGSYALTQHFLVPCRAGRGGLKGLLSSAMHRWISRGAGHVIAISEAARNGIEARNEAAPGRVSIIPNGIPNPDLRKLIPPEEVRAEFGMYREQPLIVCAARLEYEKDVKSLVAAMPAVLKVSPKATCIIAGEGSQREALDVQIRETGVGDSMRLPGFREDVLSLINAADVFVLPSLAEPFGLVLVEAMSLGRPVIATRAGGPREIVEDEITGLLVTPESPDGLAAAIVRLVADKPLRVEMGARGNERYKQYYTVEQMTSETLEVYRKMLAANSRAGESP